jgi:hypothetical protein
MSVDRALNKLAGLLARRGITSSSAALSLALTQQTVKAAPAGDGSHRRERGARVGRIGGERGCGHGARLLYGQYKTHALR